MSVFQTEFYSKVLTKNVQFNVLIPNDVPEEMIKDNENYSRSAKTLFLLHGYSGNHNDWLMLGNAREISMKYNLAIVLPSGGNSFYVDVQRTSGRYGEMIGEELVAFVQNTFGLALKREDTFIGGLSMGGFGALRNGLKYSEKFSKIIALSSALIIHQIENIQEGYQDQIADYEYYKTIFGDLRQLDSSDKNPEALIAELQEQGKVIPEIFMACGTEDFLIENNRQFKKFLDDKNVEIKYIEDKGIHDWKFWNKYIEVAVEWLLA